MSKVFNFTDNSPLEAGKIFVMNFDDIPGVAGSSIIRTYGGVADAEQPLYGYSRPRGRNVGWDNFKAEDDVLVKWWPDHPTDPGYYLMRLLSHRSRRSSVLWNGNQEAGYTNEIAGDINDNSEDFTMGTGLQVGYGGDNSSERILVKKEVSVDNKTRLGVFSNTMYLGDPFNVDNRNVLIGYATLTEPYTLGLDYDEEYTFADTDVSFDGKTIITGLTLNSEPVGDILVDIYDSLGVLIARFPAIVIDQTEIHIVNANLPAVLTPDTYTLGTIRFPTNSVVIGHNTEMPKSNEIIIGAADGSQTVRIRGAVVTDDPLTGSAILSDLLVNGTTFDFTGTVATFGAGTNTVFDSDVVFNGEAFFSGVPTSFTSRPTFSNGASFTDVTKQVDFYSKAQFSSAVVFNETVTFNDNLSFVGEATFKAVDFTKNVHFLEGLTVDPSCIVDCNSTSVNFIQIDVASTLNTFNFNCVGFSTFDGINTFNQLTSFNNTVAINAPGTGSFLCGKDASFNTGTVSFGNGFTVTGGDLVVNTGSNSTVDDLTVEGTLAVDGDVTFVSGLTVQGSETVNGNFNCFGTGTFFGSSTFVGVVDIDNIIAKTGFYLGIGAPVSRLPAIPDALTPATLDNVRDTANNILVVLRQFGFIDS